jgi:predicted DNA-binding protein with PD1-like motif
MLAETLAAALRDEQVACGWMRASGVLTDVELRVFDAEIGSLGSTRRIAGPVHVLALEGSIGVADGEPSFSLRALLARETDSGVQTLAGEIQNARTIALEVLVTVLEDLALARSVDEAAGVWLFDPSRAGSPSVARPVASAGGRAPAPAVWSAALEASAEGVRDPARLRPAAGTTNTGMAAPIRPRPNRPQPDLDAPMPEAGDFVDHFAFGRCEVLKSDGDRLHLKVGKDGRIREIALEMLRVTRLDEGDGKRRFKLERRI